MLREVILVLPTTWTESPWTDMEDPGKGRAVQGSKFSNLEAGPGENPGPD